MEKIIKNTKLILFQGDITKISTDAIVNAANNALMGGGGVDGAIHQAGGPQILEECQTIIAKIGHLPTGEAVITTGGKLPSGYVIHTVGPIWHGGGQNEPQLLKNAYWNSLQLAMENNIKRIAFPSISTGVYRYPRDKAATIALGTIIEFIKQNDVLTEIMMVLFSERDYGIYSDVLRVLE